MRSLFILLFLSACAHSPNTETSKTTESKSDRSPASLKSSHETVFGHTHQHGAPGCNHKKVTEGFNTYYIHDGKKHQPHAGHVDLVQ